MKHNVETASCSVFMRGLKVLVISGSLLLWACSSAELATHQATSSKSHPQADNPFSRDFAPKDSESPTPGFDWPVNEARLTRGFFTKPKKRRGRPHLGIDLASGRGTPIYSSHEGLVIYVGKEFRGYGRMIMVEGRDGYATLYAHLSSASVRAGDRVRKGEVIGSMGNTGRSTGVHLHFEIRRKDGPVDPLMYLPGGTDVFKRAMVEANQQVDQAQLGDSWFDSLGLGLTPASMKGLENVEIPSSEGQN